MAKFAYLESVEFVYAKVYSAVQDGDEVESNVACQMHWQVVKELVIQPQRELLLLLNVAHGKLDTGFHASVIQGEKVRITQNCAITK